ncbi:unnamed protein product [Closterium sp. NIES-53]
MYPSAINETSFQYPVSPPLPSSPTLDFVLDSGATETALKDAGTLTRLPLPTKVHGADSGFSIPCTHLSTLPCTAFPSGKVTGLHIPTLRNNLLSHRELQGAGITVIYPGFVCYCDLYQSSSGRFLLRIPLCPRTHLYTLRTPLPSFCQVTTRAGTSTGPPPPLPPPQVSPSPTSLPSSSLPTSSLTPSPSSSTALSHPAVILHHRLGHPNFASLCTTVTSRLLHSLPPTLPPLLSSPAPPYPSCIHGNLKQSPHHNHPIFAAAPIDIVHMDLWGPYPIRSRQGHWYMLVLVDDHGRYSTVFFLHSKDQVPAVVINWAEQCRNHFKRPIGCLHSDGGGEFINNTLATFCKTHGIQQTSTLPHSPQQNGIAESRIREITKIARRPLPQSHPPLPPFGAMPSSMPPSSSIFAPTLSIPHPPPQNSGPRPSLTLPAFAFGAASLSSSSHRPIAPVPLASSPPVPLSASTSGTIVTPRATCSSTLPPAASSAAVMSSSTSPSPTTPLLLLTLSLLPLALSPGPTLCAHSPLSLLLSLSPFSATAGPAAAAAAGSAAAAAAGSAAAAATADSAAGAAAAEGAAAAGSAAADSAAAAAAAGQQQQQQQVQPHRATSRSSSFLLPRMHTRSLDKVIGAPPLASIQLLEDSHEEFFNIRHHTLYLASIFLDFLGLPVLGATSTPTIFTPSTFREATSCPDADKWIAAIFLECGAFIHNDFFVDVPLPADANLVEGKWVFRVKQLPGEDLVYKARYCVKGFTQTWAEDYWFTYAPTAKPPTLRTLLDVGARDDMEICSMDVSNAFLQGDLHERIFLRRPPGFHAAFPANTVWQLLTCLWSEAGAKGVAREAVCHLFLRSSPRRFILVYVDDMILLVDSKADMELMKQQLQQRLKCKDLGDLTHYLGMAITRDRPARTITLSQSHYIGQILEKFEMAQTSPMATSLLFGHQLAPPTSPSSSTCPYAELVGSLMYAMMCTRPDLAYPISVLARFVGTGRHTEPDRRSSRGYGFTLGSLVSWRSTRSSSVSLSSCEAELYADTMAAQESRWLCFLLAELGAPQPCPTLWCDNASTIHLTQDPVYHARSKHIELRYFFIRELIQRGLLAVSKIAAEANLADIFTKALLRPAHSALLHLIGFARPGAP